MPDNSTPAALPPWADALRAELEAHPDEGFRWLDPGVVATARELLLKGWGEYPMGDDLQEAGRARIARSVPVASGPTRNARLTQNEQPMVLLFDPEAPDHVFAALGVGLPPPLWPRAEPTRAGLLRDLAPYLGRPFESCHVLPSTFRAVLGALEDLGFETLERFAEVLAHVEPWLDGTASWGSARASDPWPDDMASASMFQLRAIRESATEQAHGARKRISVRTLWSRSVLTLEQAPFGQVVIEMRYRPAPFVAPLERAGGRVEAPDDLPVDLLASLARTGIATAAALARSREAEGMTPFLGLYAVALAPADMGTYELLREMFRDPELRKPALDLASQNDADGLLYELACDAEDEALRRELTDFVELVPAGNTEVAS